MAMNLNQIIGRLIGVSKILDPAPPDCTVLLNVHGRGQAILSTLDGEALAKEIEMFKASLG